MAQQVRDIMTEDIESVERDTPLREVARIMRDRHIGDVLVTRDGGRLCGIVTDRDLVVRAIAAGRDPDETSAGEICTEEMVHLEPTSSISDAVALMRDRAIRRIPVVDGGRPIGIVTLGDLARHQDSRSALADISAAPANR